jgi:prevent-host-death family protein
MVLRANDVVSFSDARARLSELSDEVVRGSEKVLTKNGAAYVALVDAKKLDYYHALEQEHANLVLVDEAMLALQQLASGERVSEAALLQALG